MRPVERPAPATGRLGAALRPLRPSRAALGYALFTLVAFLAALVWTLPHDLIAARALEAVTAGAPLTASFARAAFVFPNGYRFTGLRLTPVRAPDAAVTLDELTARTPLLGLVLGAPRGARLSGRAFGGTLAGDVAVEGGRATAHLELQGVDLSRALAAFVPPPGRVSGRAGLELELAGDGRGPQGAEGTARLAVQGLELEDIALRGAVLPRLAFPDVAASAQLLGSRLQLKELRAAGDALDLDVTGDVLLRDPMQQSVLNLRVTIDVSSAAPPALRMATALLPRRDAGERPTYTVSGTLASPVLR